MDERTKIRREEKRASRKAFTNRFDGGSYPCLDETTKTNFTIQIENLDTVPHTVALFAGLLSSKEQIARIAGMSVDAIAAEGIVLETDDTDKDPLVRISAKDLEFVQNFVKQNPTAVTNIQVSGKDELQLAQPLTYKCVHPFKKSGEIPFTPKDFQQSKDPNTKLVNLSVSDFVLGSESVVTAVVAPGNWLSLTFFFGATADPFQMVSKYEQAINA